MRHIVEFLLSRDKPKIDKESIINGFRNIVSTENEKDSKELNSFIDVLEKFTSFEYIESIYDLLNELIEDAYKMYFSVGTFKEHIYESTKAICLLKVASDLCIMCIYNIPKAKCLIMLVNDKEIVIHIGSDKTSAELIKKLQTNDTQTYHQSASFDNKSSNVSKFNEQINWIKE